MDWDALSDVIAQEILGRSTTAKPRGTGPIELDLDTIDFLISELRAQEVLIDDERDAQLSLDEVDAHPLTGTLAPHLGVGNLLEVDNPTWFCSNVIEAYIDARRAPTAVNESPSVGGPAARPKECELCSRPMPLTQHHLYPRSEHARLLKRNLVPDKRTLLHTVAYLCRPCHSAVHRMIDSETLAREFFSVERLQDHDGVQRWVVWAEKQRISGLGLRTSR